MFQKTHKDIRSNSVCDCKAITTQMSKKRVEKENEDIYIMKYYVAVK